MLQAQRTKLRQEAGVTDLSLENAAVLVAEYGRPNLVKLWWDERMGYRVWVKWPNNFGHTFSGFAWGYSGTGPGGLAQFAGMIGLDGLLDILAIIDLPDRTEKLFMFVPRMHGGEPEWVS